MKQVAHSYIERDTGKIVEERLIADRFISLLYHPIRENCAFMLKAITSQYMSRLLAEVHYGLSLTKGSRGRVLLQKLGVNIDECVAPPETFTNAREVFERQISYWNNRPMEFNTIAIVSPADCRILLGSFREESKLFIKEKFFYYEEFLQKKRWKQTFSDGDYCVCRLTPDKYHYNHFPVSGEIVDHYEIDGNYHSCNPSATVAIDSIYSKNKRVVTVINTDVPGGNQVGMVAMIEIVALMIGGVQQAYSTVKYNNPSDITIGMFVEKGAPKSLYHPGSSTDVLIFEKGKIHFSRDLVENAKRQDVQSRFINNKNQNIVETDIQVRSTIATAQ